MRLCSRHLTDAGFRHGTLRFPGRRCSPDCGGRSNAFWPCPTTHAYSRATITGPADGCRPGRALSRSSEPATSTFAKPGPKRVRRPSARARDANLPLPKLMLHALQVNIAGGRLPAPEANGRRYLKVPLNAFPTASLGIEQARAARDCGRSAKQRPGRCVALMTIHNSIVEAIGNTPLIELRRASASDRLHHPRQGRVHEPGPICEGSGGLVHHSGRREATASFDPGGSIVEGTAGNTGIGLALVGNVLGYRTVIVIPATQTQEKKDMLRICGAELIEVPAVPYANPNNYVKVSGRLAERLAQEEPNGAIWANQFDNVANRDGHYETTGPENLGANGWPDRWLRLCGRNGRHSRGCRIRAQRAQPECRDRPRRPNGSEPL